tara:strand:+ start:102 stop:422 length:321 start_codon:yes stop_codon:yes gene_type:complete
VPDESGDLLAGESSERSSNEKIKVQRAPNYFGSQRGWQGQKVGEVCRQHEISPSLYYRWKSQYGGMEASELRKMKALEAENRRLQKMYADFRLVHDALRDAMAKKL